MKKHLSIGFIGGGRVSRILLEGWRAAGTSLAPIRVVEPDEQALAKLIEVWPRVEPGTLAAAAGCELVFLAVHPPILGSLLQGLSAALGHGTTVVSLVPKVRIHALEAALGTRRVVRMIPNAPSAIGAGYNPVAFGRGIDAESRRRLEALFAPWGEHPEVPEEHLEIYAVVTAMGPTYFWYQIQTLRDLAISLGLTTEAAGTAVLRMLDGAARCLLERGPETVDLVPIRPLRDIEPVVVEAFETRLREVFGRLTS